MPDKASSDNPLLALRMVLGVAVVCALLVSVTAVNLRPLYLANLEADFAILGGEFGNNCNDNPELSCAADCTGDNVVGIPDFTDLSNEFGNKVGDSGITTAQCNPTTCRCTPQ